MLYLVIITDKGFGEIMTIIQAILLGIVQGLTEFLPVSSSGHLAILQNFFGIETPDSLLFEVLLHAATLLAVFVAFWDDIRKLLVEAVGMLYDVLDSAKKYLMGQRRGKKEKRTPLVHNNYRKLVALILVSTIPTAVLGLSSRNLVEAASGNLLAPGIGLLLTGVLLLVVDSVKTGKKIPKNATYAQAMWIGICQGLAVFPGISRSGITIAACMLCGFNRKFSVKYSFLMSVPAIIGAVFLEAPMAGHAQLTISLALLYLLSAILAGVVGYFVIKFMVVLVQRQKFKYFAIYCFFMGILSIAGNFLVH